MRDIKFRFYSNASERYVSDNDNYAVCGNGDIYHLPDAYYDKFEPVNSEYAIKEQYTGLKDKNGVEIYEGDIANCWDECGFEGFCANLTGEVAFDGGCFCVKDSKGVHNKMALTCAENVEVIGNVHQNPELLGK